MSRLQGNVMRETFTLLRLCGDNEALATGVAKQGASSWLWYPFQTHLQAYVHSPTVYLPKSWQKNGKIPTKRSSPALCRGQLAVPPCSHTQTLVICPHSPWGAAIGSFWFPCPGILVGGGLRSMCLCFFFLGFYLKAHGFLQESTSPVLGAA